MRGVDAAWLAVDWGSSRLRVWAIAPDGVVVGEAHTAEGAADLEPGGFEPCLLAAAADFLDDTRVTRALICGMAGARSRWREAPYIMTPCSPLDVARRVVAAPTRDARLSAYILPGVAQRQPCDVMRGEETQLAGLLARRPDFCGVACLPGTHTKWARIADGKITAFTTLMSGEMFYLCAQVSVLRSAISSAPGEWDESAFVEALRTTFTHPEKIAAALFSIRAESVLRDLPSPVARARLSGYWLGLEIAATRAYWHDAGTVAIIGEPMLCRQYQRALAEQKVVGEILAAQEMTLAGLLNISRATGAGWLQ